MDSLAYERGRLDFSQMRVRGYSTAEPPAKRSRYDFTTTFDIVVGKIGSHQKCFPVYQDLLTTRSGFLMAARIAEPEGSIHLTNEDPDVFSLYLNCVHSGIEALRAEGPLLIKGSSGSSAEGQRIVKKEDSDEKSADESDVNTDPARFEALIRLHLLASKLQDPQLMSMVMDEILRMLEEAEFVPNHVNLVYDSTTPGNPLRMLFRDIYVHEVESGSECDEFVRTADLQHEFWRDVALEYFSLKDPSKSIGEVYCRSVGKDGCADICYYHQHDENHPRCTSELGA